MKLLMFDWRCTLCSCKFEDMAKPDVFCLPCPECGGEAKRLISAPRLDPRMGLDPIGHPTMGDRWAKVREQRRRIEDRRALEHGED